MRGSRKVLSEGVLNSDVFDFFQLMRGSKYHLKQAFIAPPPPPTPAKHHLNGISLAGQCWPSIECCWLGSFAIVQGILTSIAKELYSFNFCDFPGGSRPPVPHPPGSAHDITSFLPFGVSRFNSACWVIFHIFCCLLIFLSNLLFKKIISGKHQSVKHFVGPDLGLKCLQGLSL